MKYIIYSIFIVVLILNLGCNNKKDLAKEIETTSLCMDILIFSADYNLAKQITTSDVHDMNSLEINKYISDIIYNSKHRPNNFTNYIHSNGSVVDAWGNPLIFCTVTDLPKTLYNKFRDEKIEATGGLVFWSIGRNSTNEQTSGDDICIMYN